MSSVSPLTVAFVNFTRKWGGVKSWTLDFGAALQERGNKVVVVCRPGTPFPEACRNRGLDTVEVLPGPKANPVAIFRLWRLFGRQRPDVVVVNISRDLDIGAVAAKLRGIPVVHRVGLVEDFEGTASERLRHRLLVDRILVPAEWMKDGLLGALPWLGQDEIAVIPNSKRGDRFTVASRPVGAVLTFGVTSQLSHSKGHRYLFRALADVLGRGVSCRLRVAGVGPLEAELKQEAQERGISGAVDFCGFQADVGAFLSTLDAFVLPSLKEGFPNTLLEALFSGLPVVAFDLDGNREMVGDDGILVPTGDTHALAEALSSVASDPELRGRLGKGARHRAEENYELTKNAARLEEFLRDVAGRRCG